jgi:RNA polymerase sigma-70 factor (ECF subfamily)
MNDRFLARFLASALAALSAAGALVGGPFTEPSARAQEATEAPAARPKPADAAKPAKPVLILKYGDDRPDGKKSIAGSGEMIRFTMPEGQTNALRALRVHAARYGYPQPPKEDVEITILSEDMKEPIHTELVPYSLFKRQPQSRWTIVPFDDPVEVPKTFWVVLNFNAEAAKGVYVSYDTSTKGQYSRVGNNDEDAKETEFKGDWMVQAMLAK